MNYLNYKLEQTLLKPDKIYNLIRNMALTKYESLPSLNEAKEILESTSAKPRMCNLSIERHWPEIPTVDVSVIVPCYNAEKYVKECIVSILRQQAKCEFEIIAVDDGSRDNSGIILDQLSYINERMRVIHQDNKGFSGSRNAAISLARARTIMFVDSDDTLEPDAMNVLWDTYTNEECDFVTASFSTMNEDGSHIKRNRGKRLHGGPVARLYSREVWRDIEFPKGFWFEDTVHAYCIAPRYREAYVDKTVYRRRKHGDSISSNCYRNKTGLDAYWIVEEMIRWCAELGISVDGKLIDQTVRQIGPLMYARTLALTEKERRALFVASCDLLSQVTSGREWISELEGRWLDVVLSLQKQDYRLWKLAVSSI